MSAKMFDTKTIKENLQLNELLKDQIEPMTKNFLLTKLANMLRAEFGPVAIDLLVREPEVVIQITFCDFKLEEEI